jgi:7-keto-8-aminopelargonate synthetase-like enzyme
VIVKKETAENQNVLGEIDFISGIFGKTLGYTGGIVASFGE